VSACERIFKISQHLAKKISQHLAKLEARKLIVHALCAPGTVLLKYEGLARYLQYSKKQLLLTVVALILT